MNHKTITVQESIHKIVDKLIGRCKRIAFRAPSKGSADYQFDRWKSKSVDSIKILWKTYSKIYFDNNYIILIVFYIDIRK